MAQSGATDEMAAIRALGPLETLQQFEAIIPGQLRLLLADYLASLSGEDRVLTCRLCLLLYKVSNGHQFPREFQLRSSLAIISGQDCLVDAGTGSGKTLCVILPMLADSIGITITISPLKRLQTAQVCMPSQARGGD